MQFVYPEYAVDHVVVRAEVTRRANGASSAADSVPSRSLRGNGNDVAMTVYRPFASSSKLVAPPNTALKKYVTDHAGTAAVPLAAAPGAAVARTSAAASSTRPSTSQPRGRNPRYGFAGISVSNSSIP